MYSQNFRIDKIKRRNLKVNTLQRSTPLFVQESPLYHLKHTSARERNVNNSVRESSIVVIPAHSSMNLIQKSADDSEKVWESIKNRTVCQMGRDCNGFTVFGGRGRGRIPQPVAETRSPVLSGPLQSQTREFLLRKEVSGNYRATFLSNT